MATSGTIFDSVRYEDDAMKLSDYRDQPNNAHKEQGNQAVEVNALSAVVHLWNQGENNERLYCGLNKARIGLRRE
jgi:hypothetical protein